MLTNAQKTTLLLLSLVGISAAAGFVIGGVAGVVLAAVVVATLLLVRASLPPAMVMRLNRARPLSPWTAPVLHRLASRLARRAGVSMPRLYLISSSEPNALSTGGPQNGAVAVTTGLLDLLDVREVEGVLAHEIAHIRNDDVRLLDLVSAASGATVLLLKTSLWLSVLFLLLFGGSLARVLQLALLAFFAPLLVTWLQSALSRTRELAADATAARISGRPRELASALVKLKHRRGYLLGMFTGQPEAPPMLRSHPATEERVQRLLALAPPVTPRPIYRPSWQHFH